MAWIRRTRSSGRASRSTNLELLGADVLRANLERAVVAVTDKATLTTVLLDGAEAIRAKAASLCPRSDEPPHIADSIVAVAMPAFKGAEAAVQIGPTSRFFYGWFLEFGTIHAAPHAFMRPAFDTSYTDAQQTIKHGTWNVLAKSMTGVQGGGGLL